MTKAHVEPTTQEHMDELLENMRPEDRREVEGLTGSTAEIALQWSYENSVYLRTIKAGKAVAGVFGVSEGTIAEIGCPWLICTDKIFLISRRFLRESKTWVHNMRMVGNYSVMQNIADKRNKVHIRWLKWLGAKFYGDPIKTHYTRFQL